MSFRLNLLGLVSMGIGTSWFCLIKYTCPPTCAGIFTFPLLVGLCLFLFKELCLQFVLMYSLLFKKKQIGVSHPCCYPIISWGVGKNPLPAVSARSLPVPAELKFCPMFPWVVAGRPAYKMEWDESVTGSVYWASSITLPLILEGWAKMTELVEQCKHAIFRIQSMQNILHLLFIWNWRIHCSQWVTYDFHFYQIIYDLLGSPMQVMKLMFQLNHPYLGHLWVVLDKHLP